MLLQYKYFSYAKQSPFLFVFNANTTQLWGENGHDKSAPTLTVRTWTYIAHNKYTQRCARGHIS